MVYVLCTALCLHCVVLAVRYVRGGEDFLNGMG